MVTATQVNNGSSDTCGIRSLSLSKTSFDCSNIGANNVTLTVTDVHGLMSTATGVMNMHGDVPVTTIATTPASVNTSGKVIVYLGYGSVRQARGTAPETAATITANELSAFPNPVAENATVSFRAALDGKAQVVVYSLLGQPIATLFDGAATAG
jgi:hypothetical protein